MKPIYWIAIVGLIEGLPARAHGANAESPCSTKAGEQFRGLFRALKTKDALLPKLVYSSFKEERRCDDGAVFEGYSKLISKSFEENPETLPEFLKLMQKDSEFSTFILKHLDTTMASPKELQAAQSNTHKNCPANFLSICRSIEDQCTTQIALQNTPVQRKIAGDQFTSVFGFHLDRNTLQDVQNVLGAAHLIETGDASESDAGICYNTKSGTIDFASGEMGGGKVLSQFVVREGSPRSQCSALSDRYREAPIVISGLELGISRSKFTDLVGISVQWKKEAGSVLFEGKQPMTNEEIAKLNIPKDGQTYFDVIISIDGVFIKDRLTELKVNKATTY